MPNTTWSARFMRRVPKNMPVVKTPKIAWKKPMSSSADFAASPRAGMTHVATRAIQKNP